MAVLHYYNVILVFFICCRHRRRFFYYLSIYFLHKLRRSVPGVFMQSIKSIVFSNYNVCLCHQTNDQHNTPINKQ